MLKDFWRRTLKNFSENTDFRLFYFWSICLYLDHLKFRLFFKEMDIDEFYCGKIQFNYSAKNLSK